MSPRPPTSPQADNTGGPNPSPTRDQIEGRRPLIVTYPLVSARNLARANAAVDDELPPSDTRESCLSCDTCVELAKQLERNLHEQEQAQLAKATNDHDNVPPLPEGYERATQADLERLGLVDGDTSLLELEGHPDFQSEVFTKTNPESHERSYVIAFSGTTDFWGERRQNLGQGFGLRTKFLEDLGYSTEYYDQAELIGTQAGASGEDVTFLGHSLGGGLATTSSGASGLPAQNFNSAGLHQRSLDRLQLENPNLVNSTHVRGDLLSGIQDNSFGPDAYGTRRAIPSARNDPQPLPDWRLRGRFDRALRLHWMDSVQNALGEEENNIRLEMRLLGC